MRFLVRNADMFFVSLFAIALAIVLAFLPNPTGLDDSLRHLAMGKMMLKHGITQSYWSDFLFWGTMSHLRTDPWFLYDVFMMQCARLPNLVALDFNVFISVSALALAGFAVIRSLGLKGYSAAVFLWLLLLGDQQFFARMMIGRPFTLQTAIALGVIACVLNRKYILQFVLIASSVLLSQLFVFALFFSVIGIIWTSVARTSKEAVRLILATFIGLLTGFFLHPYPWEYLQYMTTVFLQIPLLSHYIHLSREMQVSYFDISMMSVLVAIGACILLITLFLKKKNLRMFSHTNAAYPVSLAVLFLPVYFIWIRGLDVLWPVLVLSIASLFLLVHKDICTVFPSLCKSVVVKTIAITLIACHTLAYPVWFFMFDYTRSLEAYSAALDIPDGARVIDMDWTQFSALALLQPNARYATGIDPSFLYLMDPQKYHALYDLEYANLSEADIGRLLSPLIRQSGACILAIPSSYPINVVSIIKRLPETKEIAHSSELLIMQIGRCPR